MRRRLSVDEFVDLLGQRGCAPQQVGDSQVRFRCPFHDRADGLAGVRCPDGYALAFCGTCGNATGWFNALQAFLLDDVPPDFRARNTRTNDQRIANSRLKDWMATVPLTRIKNTGNRVGDERQPGRDAKAESSSDAHTDPDPGADARHNPIEPQTKTALVQASSVATGAEPPNPERTSKSRSGRRRLRVTPANTIVAKQVTWAWLDHGAGRIPIGALSLAAGREGTGKSSFGVWMTAMVTTGRLTGIWFGKPRRVFYAAVEDSWEHTIVPRLMAAGANLSLVGKIDVTTSGEDELILSLPNDLAAFEEAIMSSDVALVVLDPLMSMMSENIDTHKNREVRGALDPLVQIANRTGAVLLGIAHFSKASGTDAANLITGSAAFKDVPRSVFGFARDDDDRVLTQIKNSLGRDDLPSLSYTMVSTQVSVEGGVTDVGRFTFTGESDRSVADVIRDSHSTTEAPTRRREIEGWLTAYLDEAGGQAPASSVIEAAMAAGFNESTLKKTRAKIGVLTEKKGFGGDSHSVWSLPQRILKESMESNAEVGDSMASMDPMLDLVTESNPTIEPAADSPTRCRTCGRPIHLQRPGRDQCEACRLAEESQRATHAPSTSDANSVDASDQTGLHPPQRTQLHPGPEIEPPCVQPPVT